jgi:hypothetical protein
MDGQHQYEITLKKDDLFINLSSDDVYFISKQMDKWFRILLDDSYVPVTLPPWPQPEPAPVVQTQPLPEPVPQEVAQPVAPVQQPVAMPQPAPQPVAEAALPQPQTQPQSQLQPQVELPMSAVAPVAPQPMPQPQPVAAVEIKPADVNLPMSQPQQPAPAVPQAMPAAMPESVVEQQPSIPVRPPVIMAEPSVAAQPQPASPEFEAVMDSLMKDLEDTDEEPLVVPDYAPVSNTMSGESLEPDLSYVTSLADLCDRSNAGSSEDYLLLSAYYLTRVERQETFSLKKINSVLVKSGLTPINHSVLESVLASGYLAMVPDLTGTAEVSEYSITRDGREAAIQLL